MKVLKKVAKKPVVSNVVSLFPAKQVKEVPKVQTQEVDSVVSYRNMIRNESLNYAKKGEMSVGDIYEISENMDSLFFDEIADFGMATTSFKPLFNRQEVHFSSSEGFDALNTSGFFTPYATSQLFSRFGIPNTYANFCIENKAHDLLIENLEHWREKFGGKYLLRYYNMAGVEEPMIRAVLTEKYKAFDTLDIMNVIRRNYDILHNYSVRNWLVNPERLHIRLVSDERLDVPSDEDLFMGINLDSSDVGRSSLRLSIIVFKQVCTNGLILPQGISRVYRQIHFGSGADRFEENVEVALGAVAQMKEVAEEVITSAGSKVLPFKIEDEDAVERFRINHKISKEAMQTIVDGVKSETYGEPSMWSLINVMTEVAQKYTIDTRLNMEREAGNLLLVA